MRLSERTAWALLTCIFALSAVVILFNLGHNLAVGGHKYLQGDWLINNMVEDVRRGPFGGWILTLSDLTGVSPVFLVGAIQTATLLALFGLLLLSAHANGHAVILLILTTSPAFLVILWAAEPAAALRKEILAFLAIALTLIGVQRGSVALVSAGAAILSLGFYAHEVVVLFFPLFWLIVFLRSDFQRQRVIWLVCALSFASAVHASLYALTYRAVTDFNTVCGPLLDRGVDPAICMGAIQWVERDVSAATDVIERRLGSPLGMVKFFLSYAAGLVGVAYVLFLTGLSRRWVALVVSCGLPFVILYPVALDWGRWVGLHVFSASVLLVAALSLDHLTLKRAPDIRIILVLFALSMIWVPDHFFGVDPGVGFQIYSAITGNGAARP